MEDFREGFPEAGDRCELHPHAYAVAKYNEYCRHAGLTTYVPQPNHRCTSACGFYEVAPCPQTGWDTIMVCKRYRSVHVCGEACGEVIQAPAGEGFVCRLTGLCLRTPVTSCYTPVSTDKRKAQSEGGVNRMDTQAPRRKRSKRESPCGATAEFRIRQKIRERLHLIFSSRERVMVWKRQRERFFVETDKLARECRRSIPVLSIDQKIRSKVAEFGAYLNPPPALFGSALADGMVSDFYDYFCRMVKISQGDRYIIPMTARQVDIYTCCMCFWLSSGLVVGSHEVVAVHPFFERHVPPEICFAELSMTCKHMSEFTRLFKRVCAGPLNTIRYRVKFEFSRLTRTRLESVQILNHRRRLSSASQESPPAISVE